MLTVFIDAHCFDICSLSLLMLTVLTYAHCFDICSNDGFEVKHEKNRYKIDIEQRTCPCRYWQISGIPCCHAISAVYIMSKDPED
jgi:hypothetical protein